MGDYLHNDRKEPNLDHPDSCIRLASVVHRFKIPKINKKVSFKSSFSTVGRNDKTRKLMVLTDDARSRLQDGLDAKKVSAERVVQDTVLYQPMIHSVLLSCKVQPDQARLDERLVFEWKSGIEEKPNAYKSEAMMYDLVMTSVAEALGHATAATEKSVGGEFAAASRDYASAAGIFDFLAEDQLPKWIAKGSQVDEDMLPSECHPPMAKALKILFMANGQQMAVATLLMKEGTPNYGLLAKLCLGIAEQLEEFVALLRRDAFTQMGRMQKDFLTLITLQTNIQKALTIYFQARTLWAADDFGIAIALMSEAGVKLQQRSHGASDGIPDVNGTALSPLKDDLKDLRAHVAFVLRAWEKDNSSVYFTRVPQQVPASKKLQEGLQMKKKTEYALQEAEPVLLVLPNGAMKRTDSDLAREMQERLNMGEQF